MSSINNNRLFPMTSYTGASATSGTMQGGCGQSLSLDSLLGSSSGSGLSSNSGGNGGLQLPGGEGGIQAIAELLADLVVALAQSPALQQALSGNSTAGNSADSNVNNAATGSDGSDASGSGVPIVDPTQGGSSNPGSVSSGTAGSGVPIVDPTQSSSSNLGPVNSGTPSSLTQSGGSTGTGGYGSTASTLTDSTASTSDVSATSAVSDDPNYSEQDLFKDIKTTLTPQNGDSTHSGASAIQYWDPSTAEGKKNLDSMYKGITTSHKEFFSNIPLSTYSKAVVANAAVESTLTPTLGHGGLMQMSPNYFSDDFAKHGKAFGALTPGGSFDQTNPEQQVEIWAWYTKNALVQGGTRPGQWGSGANGGVQNTFGNLWPTWVGGPGNANGNMQNYVPNIRAYFEKMGSAADFEKLVNTPLSSKYAATM